MAILTGLCRGFLGALFLLACAGKFEAPRKVLGTVMDFRVMPDALAPLIAAIMPGLELAIGAILAFAVLAPPKGGGWRDTVEAAEWLTLLLLVAMTALIAQALVRGIPMDCGCFDFLAKALPVFEASRITWWTVVRDLAFMVPAVWLVRRQR